MKNQIVVDTRLSKRFTFNGRRAVEGIVDVFNLLDRANYTEINNIFGAGAFPSKPQTDAAGNVTYGRYTEALPGRQMQLAVKLIF